MASSYKHPAGHEHQHELDSRIIAEAKNLAATGTPDVRAALQQLRENRDTRPAPSAHPTRITPANRTWLATSVAAAVILLVITTLIIRKDAKPASSVPAPTPEWTTITAGTTGSFDTLSDGSFIKLSPLASITYPLKFITDRQVRLSGDAFFIIAHDAAHPFRVQTHDITITVLGTSFDINTSKGQTQIAVSEGVVEVTRNQRRIRISAREKLLIPVDTGAWQKLADTVITPAPARARTTAIPPNLRLAGAVATDSPSHSPTTRMAHANDPDTSGLHTMRMILADLVAENLVPDRNSITWAALSDDELIVNGTKQSAELHQKLKEKYLHTPNQGYYYGSVQITGRGFFFDKNDLDNPPQPPRPPKSLRLDRQPAKPPVIRTSYFKLPPDSPIIRTSIRQ